jgi:hypothetical protein
LAYGQIKHWTFKNPGKAFLDESLSRINQTHPSIFIFGIRANKVIIEHKQKLVLPPELDKLYPGFMEDLRARAEYYKKFVEAVIADCQPPLNFKMAVDVNDIGADVPEVPIFTFQKQPASANILISDVDFFKWNWYRYFCDSILYENKKIVAGFVGSSTGIGDGRYVVDVKTIQERLNPRLRAAAYFVGSAKVDFRIARATQFDSDQAQALLESQPYFAKRMSWRRQFRNRFRISMDGNGAACSRVAIARKAEARSSNTTRHLTFFILPDWCPGAITSPSQRKRR